MYYHNVSLLDAESEIQAELSALPACIPTYGIEDVKEILELIYSTGTDSVAGSRPLKVINYLKVNESIIIVILNDIFLDEICWKDRTLSLLKWNINILAI